MRKLLLLTLMLCTWCATWAVPAKPGFTTHTQSDGTVIEVRVVGDEWHHSFVTRDGLTVGLADNGDFYYRDANGLTAVLAHNEAERTADERSFVAANSDNLRVGAIQTNRSKARRASAHKGRRKVGSTQVPTSGSPKVPIILVEYSDKKMSHTLANFQAQYKTGAKSVYQYFEDQSNGKYKPQFDVYGIYTLNSTRATYGENGSDGSDVGVAKMVGEAIDKAGNDINWSQYDNDGDGYADVCIVVYAGVGEAQASYTVPNSIWPVQWNLASGAYYGDGTGTRTRNGVIIDKFAVFNEINGSEDSGTTMDGIGTFCHEFSHCLGLPDFYETTYSNGYFGMSYWSLMNSGCYNGGTVSGDTPIGYSGYEKNFMDWINYITPTENTQYTLSWMNQKQESTDQAIKVVSPLNANEYYVLENRKKQGWDYYIDDEGLMVTHVTYIADRWENNSVNDQAIQLFTIIPADNQLKSSSDDANGDGYSDGPVAGDERTDLFGETNHELTDTSTPAAKLNMKANGSLASTTGGAGYMSKPLTEINLNSNGTVSLWYMKGNVQRLDNVTLNDATNIGTTSFTASWTDNITADHTYTLEVNKKGAVSTTPILTETFSKCTKQNTSTDISSSLNTYTDNSGWTGTKVYQEVGGVKLGSSSVAGVLTTPSLDLTTSSGKVTVKFNAMQYGTGNEKTLSIKSGNSTAQSQTLTTTASDYVAVIDCSTATGQTISFTASKRAYIYNVEVYLGDVSASLSSSSAPRRAVSETGDADSRTITGITAKNYTVNNLTQGATYEFKVKAVPDDATEYEESNWSTKEVTLNSGPQLAAMATNDSVKITAPIGTQAIGTFDVLGSDLEGSVSIALSGTDASKFALSTSTISKADAEAGATVTVTYTAPSTVGTHIATVTLTSQNVDPVTLTLEGKAVKPELIAEDETVTINTVAGVAKSDTLGILGANLKGNVTLTLADANNVFSIDPSTISKADAESGNATVVITYSPTALGTHNATLTIASDGADNVTVALNGTATGVKYDPVMSDPDMTKVTTTSFTADWTDQTDASTVSSYTLYVNKKQTTVNDVLDREATGVTSTSYAAWSGKTGASGAVYAGQSAGGNESIQLRTTNSNSGIVSTTSGGKIKKVTVN